MNGECKCLVCFVVVVVRIEMAENVLCMHRMRIIITITIIGFIGMY